MMSWLRAVVALSLICHSLAGNLNYGTGFGHVIGGGLMSPGRAVYSAPAATIAAASATPVAVSKPAPPGLAGPATLTVTVGALGPAPPALPAAAVKLSPPPVVAAQPAAGATVTTFPAAPPPSRPPPPVLVGAPPAVTVTRPAVQHVFAAPPQAASRPIAPPPQVAVPVPARPTAVAYHPPLPRPTYTYQAPLPVTFTRQVYHNPYAAVLPPHLAAFRPHLPAFPGQVLSYQGGLPYAPQSAFTATTYHHPPPSVGTGPPGAAVTSYRGPLPVTRHVFMMYPAPVPAAYSPQGQLYSSYPAAARGPVAVARPVVATAPVAYRAPVLAPATAVGYSGGVAYGMANVAVKQRLGTGHALGGHNYGLGGRHYLVNKKKS